MTATLRRAVVWCVLGLVVVPLDALHVYTGVLSYRAPTSWMPGAIQAAWVLPLFCGAGLAMGFGHRHGATRAAGVVDALPAGTWVGALVGLCALVFAYASSGALQAWPVAALCAYSLVWAAIVWGVHPRAKKALVLHSLGTALIGPAVEIAISSTGAFTYSHKDILGVALWLPGIYLNAAAASHLIDRWLVAREAVRVSSA